MDQIRLGLGSPDCAARTFAVTEPRAIEHDDTVPLRSHGNETARLEILDHAAVAVQQNQRLSLTTLDIVEPDAVDFDKSAGRRIITLGFLRHPAVNKGRDDQSPDGNGGSHCVWSRFYRGKHVPHERYQITRLVTAHCEETRSHVCIPVFLLACTRLFLHTANARGYKCSPRLLFPRNHSRMARPRAS